MKNPTRERHHRERVINNRLHLIRDTFDGWGWGNKGPGSLNKDHFTNCSCTGCANERTILHRRKHAPRKRKQRTCKPQQWAAYEQAAHTPAPPRPPTGERVPVMPGYRHADWAATVDHYGYHRRDHDWYRPRRVKVGDVWATELRQATDS